MGDDVDIAESSNFLCTLFLAAEEYSIRLIGGDQIELEGVMKRLREKMN